MRCVHRELRAPPSTVFLKVEMRACTGRTTALEVRHLVLRYMHEISYTLGQPPQSHRSPSYAWSDSTHSRLVSTRSRLSWTHSLTFESVPLTKLSLHLFLKLLHEGAPRLGLAIHLPFVRNDHELCHRLAEEPEEGALLGGGLVTRVSRRGPC